ncbi:MAG: hypothetical protein JKY48_14345 [Flavobacteriales bacterium]|nr:hypothetical protein [Flavobacteriales bacterium]
MKLKVHLLFWGIIVASVVRGQEINISAGYQYIYSSEWDKAIQRYNFARPFMDKAQPLLIHGGYIEAAYFFASDRKFNSGVKSSYAFTRSSSKNTDEIAINLQQFNLGYSLKYSFNGRLKGCMLEADITALSTILNKRINNEIELIDEEKNRAFGIGLNFGITTFYKIEIGDKRLFSPFIGVGYSPYLRSPESESVLDQSISTSGTKDIRIINWKLGVRYTFLKAN